MRPCPAGQPRPRGALRPPWGANQSTNVKCPPGRTATPATRSSPAGLEGRLHPPVQPQPWGLGRGRGAGGGTGQFPAAGWALMGTLPCGVSSWAFGGLCCGTSRVQTP